MRSPFSATQCKDVQDKYATQGMLQSHNAFVVVVAVLVVVLLQSSVYIRYNNALLFPFSVFGVSFRCKCRCFCSDFVWRPWIKEYLRQSWHSDSILNDFGIITSTSRRNSFLVKWISYKVNFECFLKRADRTIARTVNVSQK